MTESLPEGVRHYAAEEEVPDEVAKYWHQRYKIFSKFDEGVWLTDEAWFGITPEPIASKIAEHVASAAPTKTVLIDAFAGAGGNVIQFALSGRWKQIFAVEKNAQVLACAKHNAELYGVHRKIFWIEGDIFDVLRKQLKGTAKNAVLFASPPWGGPAYSDSNVFDLAAMEPYSLEHLYNSFRKVDTDFVLYLPRTSDLKQLVRFAKSDEKLRVIHYCMHGASKALCTFHGTFELD